MEILSGKDEAYDKNVPDILEIILGESHTNILNSTILMDVLENILGNHMSSS